MQQTLLRMYINSENSCTNAYAANSLMQHMFVWMVKWQLMPKVTPEEHFGTTSTTGTLNSCCVTCAASNYQFQVPTDVSRHLAEGIFTRAPKTNKTVEALGRKFFDEEKISSGISWIVRVFQLLPTFSHVLLRFIML